MLALSMPLLPALARTRTSRSSSLSVSQKSYWTSGDEKRV
jgi:hypothetical protein